MSSNNRLEELRESEDGNENNPQLNTAIIRSSEHEPEIDLETAVTIPESEGDPEPVVAVDDQNVKLQVGERHFETTKLTLEEAGFFRTQFKGVWLHNARPDGSFYVDKDGDLFEHILRYMRSLVLPIFYDKVKGHDEVLYSHILEEAKFYGIDRLEKWIRERGYLQAVKVTTSIRVTDYIHSQLFVGVPQTFGNSESSSELEIRHYPVWTHRKVYICPRRIAVHMGDSSRCGRQCNNAKRGEDEIKEVPVFKVGEIKKKVTIDRDLLLGGWDE